MTVLKDLTRLSFNVKIALAKIKGVRMPIDLKQIWDYRRELLERASELDEIITPAAKDLQEIRKKLAALDDLLRLEGERIDDVSVRQIAYDTLVAIGKPTHYRELLGELGKRGYEVPGKDPATNLLAHLLNDPRFTKAPEIGRGYYKLKEWDKKKE
jgi:hypothetical protein